MAAIMPTGTPISTIQIMVMLAPREGAARNNPKDHARDRRLKENRRSKVATGDIRQPAQVLGNDRLIEPQLRSQGVDLIRRRDIAEQDVNRIARYEMNEEEDDHRSRGQSDRRGGGPMQSVGPH